MDCMYINSESPLFTLKKTAAIKTVAQFVSFYL